MLKSYGILLKQLNELNAIFEEKIFEQNELFQSRNRRNPVYFYFKKILNY